MGSRSLATCLEEAVTAIRTHRKDMPEDSDPEEWFDMHPDADAGSRQVNYFVGYLEGVADALDMTVKEVLDHEDVDYSNEEEKDG